MGVTQTYQGDNMKCELGLTEIHCMTRWGAMPAMLQKASLDRISTGLSIWKLKYKILKQQGICGRIEAMLSLDGLSVRIREKLLNPDLKDYPLTQKINRIEKLRKIHIIDADEIVSDLTIVGWEIATLSFLARASRDVGYLTDEMAFRFMRDADTFGKAFPFNDWGEYSKSCLIGWGIEKSCPRYLTYKMKRYESILLRQGNLWGKTIKEWDIAIF